VRQVCQRPYKTLNDAINALPGATSSVWAGWTIIVKGGAATDVSLGGTPEQTFPLTSTLAIPPRVHLIGGGGDAKSTIASTLITGFLLGPLVTLGRGSILEGFFVKNTRLSAGGDGVVVNDLRGIVRNVHVYGCTGAGIAVETTSSDVAVIEGGSSYGNKYGIEIRPDSTNNGTPNHVLIRDCDVSGNTTANIQAHVPFDATGPGNSLTIEHCRIHNAGQTSAKIKLLGVSNVDIRNNYLEWAAADSPTNPMITIDQALGGSGLAREFCKMIHIHDNYFHGTAIGALFPGTTGRLVDANYVQKLVFERNYVKGGEDPTTSNPLVFLHTPNARACQVSFDALHKEDGSVMQFGAPGTLVQPTSGRGNYGTWWDDTVPRYKLWGDQPTA
jgi:hypothetical protein